MLKRVRGGALVVILISLWGCSGKAAKDPDEVAGPPTSGAPATVPVELPYPDDTCESLHLEFDRGLDPASCPPVGCDCGRLQTLSFPTARGCLISLDCSAVCAAPNPDFWPDCALFECLEDADCIIGSWRCFVPPGRKQGRCGQPGVDCIDAGDCTEGSSCVAVDPKGTRHCVVPGDRSSCNRDEHCPDGAHCVLYEDYPIGSCTTGELQTACSADDDCGAGLVCGANACSDGKHESSCTSDDDCDTGTCRWETCVDGRDQDYCDQDGDCRSGICVYGIRCSDGAIDEGCEYDTDCQSGICAGDNGGSACTDGASGSKCLVDADCASGACRYDVALRPGDYFGRCD
jgi:hypothetical protein